MRFLRVEVRRAHQHISKKVKKITYSCIYELIESKTEGTRNNSRRWNGMECVKSFQRGPNRLGEIFESKEEVMIMRSVKTRAFLLIYMLAKIAEHVN